MNTSMNTKLKPIADMIHSRLVRKAITSSSKWAMRYRVMGGGSFPGPWSFKHHPWLRGMHECDARKIVGKKAAQMGFTEWAINSVLYSMDMKGMSCLYVLPASKPDAADFSTGRFDPILDLSPHIKAMFHDVKNIGHKRAGHANLYIRGSRSRAQLKSIPTGDVTFDEVDEMVQNNIPLAIERMSGQVEKFERYISTPTVADHGIDKMFQNTTQNFFTFKCPHCGKHTQLIYPECLVITAEKVTDPGIKDTHLICKECKHTLAHEQKVEFLKDGFWESAYPDRPEIGFGVNQMYSMTIAPPDLAASYLRGLENLADRQEFFNSKIGVTHAPDGAKITQTMLNNCKKDYSMANGSRSNNIVTMGIDVGTFFDVEIDEWIMTKDTGDLNSAFIPKVLHVGRYKNIQDVYNLMSQYTVNYCVMDANPERKMATAFAQSFYGHVSLCIYARGVAGRLINPNKSDYLVNVDRTYWMDVALGRFKEQKIILPVDLPYEYGEQVKAPTKIYVKDVDGNPVSKYVEGSADHLAHARTYAEIALPLAAGKGRSEDYVE